MAERADGYPGEFKKARVYESIDEARKGLTGDPASIERMAKARMAAQKLGKEIRKQRGFK